MRRSILFKWTYALFFALSLSSLSNAQTYPEKPITIVIPMGAGGASDTLMRTIAPELSSQIGQPVIIDNRPGANGLIGEEFFSRSRSDGYTWMLGTTSATTNLWLHKLNYDPKVSFVPVMKIAAVPMALVVNSSKIPSKTVKEFIDFSKNKNPQLTYATWGEGSVSHLTMELFKSHSQVNAMHIPYKTSPQALNDVLAGQVDSLFVGLAAANQQLSSGKLKILAITSPIRSIIAPQIPTMAESGYPGVEFESWFGIFVPAETPKNIVQIIHTQLTKTLNQALLKNKLSQAGYRVIADTTEEFSKYFMNEINANEKIIKAATSN